VLYFSKKISKAIKICSLHLPSLVLCDLPQGNCTTAPEHHYNKIGTAYV